jgi:hypothetical protein
MVDYASGAICAYPEAPLARGRREGMSDLFWNGFG